MWQPGHTDDTMARSRAISCPHPVLPQGYAVPPFWSTLRKQPFAVVHGGRLYVLRYVARSASAFGLSNASTMATVRPLPFVVSSAYALCRSHGVKPEWAVEQPAAGTVVDGRVVGGTVVVVDVVVVLDVGGAVVVVVVGRRFCLTSRSAWHRA